MSDQYSWVCSVCAEACQAVPSLTTFSSEAIQANATGPNVRVRVTMFAPSGLQRSFGGDVIATTTVAGACNTTFIDNDDGTYEILILALTEGFSQIEVFVNSEPVTFINVTGLANCRGSDQRCSFCPEACSSNLGLTEMTTSLSGAAVRLFTVFITTFSNLPGGDARVSGGDDVSVLVASGPGTINAVFSDHNNGSYSGTVSMSQPGNYTLDFLLDGLVFSSVNVTALPVCWPESCVACLVHPDGCAWADGTGCETFFGSRNATAGSLIQVTEMCPESARCLDNPVGGGGESIFWFF